MPKSAFCHESIQSCGIMVGTKSHSNATHAHAKKVNTLINRAICYDAKLIPYRLMCGKCQKWEKVCTNKSNYRCLPKKIWKILQSLILGIFFLI